MATMIRPMSKEATSCKSTDAILSSAETRKVGNAVGKDSKSGLVALVRFLHKCA
jgi:hypothetical protein